MTSTIFPAVILAITIVAHFIVSIVKKRRAATDSRAASDAADNPCLTSVPPVSPSVVVEETALPTIDERTTIGERIKAALVRQGLEYEEDGDSLTFRWHFLTWRFHHTDSKDYFQLALGFDNDNDLSDPDMRDVWLTRANQANANYRMVKVMIFGDAIVFTAETFLSPTCDIDYQLRHSLQILEAVSTDFRLRNVDDKENDDDDNPAPPAAPVNIDAILEKINAEGYDSLTEEEKAQLLRASNG